MNIWTIKANEPLPIEEHKQRLFRMGLINKELVKRGHTVTWFATTFDHFTKKQLFNKDTMIDVKENYKLNILWSPKYKKNISIKRIINHKYLSLKLKKEMNRLEKPDLIYVAFPTIDLAMQAIKYGKKNNIPVIVDIRDLWPDIFKYNLTGVKRIIAKPYIKVLDKKTKKIMKNAYAIFSITPEMLEWGLNKADREIKQQDKSVYIGYEIPEKKLKNIENSEIKINKDNFIISFSGTLNNQYNYNVIIETAKLLKNEGVDFYICGDGPQYKDILKKAESLDNIKFLGWLNNDDMDYVLRNSNIGFASYKNIFNFQMNITNKFAEFLSYKLPIIVTVDGYMAKFVKENKCGIFSTDAEQISKYILQLKNNKDMYMEISQNSLQMFEKNFVAEKIYNELANHIERIGKKTKKEA